uniref:Catenin (Cadherin-associated protein), beta 1 n=1 Tax=Tetraselmis sp. GSL018 TaxID=582737 RepID=A0A061RVG2_9CHLO
MLAALNILKSAAAASVSHSPSQLSSQPPAPLPNVLRLTAGLAKDRSIAAALQETGAVRPLVQLLAGPWGISAGGASEVLYGCVDALRWISEARAAQEEMRECGGIPLLVGLLTPWQVGTGAEERVLVLAAAALRHLAANSRNRDAIREAGAIPRLVALLEGEPGGAAALQAAAALTNLSRKKRSNMIAIAEAGGIPLLVGLLWQGPGSEAAMLALGALTNLAYTSGNRDIIREAGGIPALVSLLEACSSDVERNSPVLSQVVAVIGNLAGTSRNRDAIREAGALPLMVKLVEDRNPNELIGLAVSALTLLALSHTNAEAILKEGAVPALVGILSCSESDEDLTFKAAEAIRVLSAAPVIRSALRDAGALEALVALLGPIGAPLRRGPDPQSADLFVEVILAIRNLVTSTRNQDRVRELGGVTRLVQILCDPEVTAREQLHGVSALINLFAHNSSNREFVRVSGGITAFVGILQHSIVVPETAKSELTAQAALALGFLARSDANREAIRVAGGIPLLVKLLDAGPAEEVTLCAVDALRHVVATPTNSKSLLKAGGVGPLLRLLEAGPEHEVTQQSLWVLKALARSMAATEAIRTLGGLPLLVQLLDIGADNEATIQAAAVLRDMADVDCEEGLRAICASGAIPGLVKLLQTGDSQATVGPAMAAAAIANLAQTDSIRDEIERAGAVQPLIDLLRAPSQESQVLVKASAALFNISQSEKCRARIVEAQAVPVLAGFLPQGESAVATWAAAVLASLARSDYGRHSILEAGAVPLIVDLLRLGSMSGAARQASAAAQELACGFATRDALVCCGAVPALQSLHSGARGDRELAECCLQALANLARHHLARAELHAAGALDEMLSRARASDRASSVGHQESSPSSSNDTMDGMLHVPEGGWSWQQVGRQHDYQLHQLSPAGSSVPGATPAGTPRGRSPSRHSPPSRNSPRGAAWTPACPLP